MTAIEIRKQFLDFMKAHGHAIVPSSSLVPSDPSVLLTTAGMQQFKPYYTGEANADKDFGSKNTATVQKSFRTSDIDEVGDETHLTFFEMLGNFSFGCYFKKEAIELAHKFITEEMKLPISYVTVFSGDRKAGVPKDEESRGIWNALGVSDVREEGMSDVFWGPTGSSGPCGPTTEIYCQNEAMKNAGIEPVEIWNIVFNQYFYPGSREELNMGVPGKKLEPLPMFGVDTGMGLERLAMISQGKKNIFEADLFTPILNLLSNGPNVETKRIIVDHLRGGVFLIADGVQPSNKDRGYILRRVLRRAISHIASKERFVSIPLGAGTPKELNERVASIIKSVTDATIKEYGGWYKELYDKNGPVDMIVRREVGKSLDLLKSSSELRKVIELHRGSADKKILGQTAFGLFSTFGISIDYLRDEAEKNNLTVDEAGFESERKKHQEISKAGQEKKFGGHGLLLDTGELKAGNEEELKIVTRLHTATHMLQRALREVLGAEVHQAGSDITAERTRFDFTFPRKLVPEEIKKVEDLINEKIKEDLSMQKVVLPKAEAEKTGALYFFKEKYPDPVNVYFIGHDVASAWSKEFCGGPHVTHTGEIGKFKIVKEEAVGAGVRRIRAAVE